LTHHLIRRDHLLALEMAAALGENLILEDDAGGAGALELLHAAHDVVQVAVTGVAVGDDRDRHAVRHAPHGVGHLLHAEEVQVRQAVEAGLVAKPPMNTVSNPACSISTAVSTSWAPSERMMPGICINSRNRRVGLVFWLMRFSP